MTDTEQRLRVLRYNLRQLARAGVDATQRAAALERDLLRLRAQHEQLQRVKTPVPVTHTPHSASRKRGRAAVVSWDLGHNPAGRAMVLYDLLERDFDVELIGPIWKRYGNDVWRPIATSARKVRGFRCDTFEQFYPAALSLSANANYDLVVVCKPRLPALLLGLMIKKSSGCPLILDVDDFELSFFKNEAPATLDDLEEDLAGALMEPYEELATRACEPLISEADAVIVSNVALRARYGGIIVRHARNEEAFRIERFDRRAERSRLGITEDDFAIVFVGTPRAHKGVFEVARVLDQLQDKRFVMHIVADIADKRVLKELARYRNARVVLHPGCDFDELPARLAAADAVVLLQDPAHPISQYQIPAKISDAAAFGIPLLMTDVPPIRDLAAQGVVTVTDAGTLAADLQRLCAIRDTAGANHGRDRIRESFECELGFAVNRERLHAAAERAARHSAGELLAPAFDRLLSLADQAYRQLRNPPPAPAVRPTGQGAIDIVMFWKQNDTGLYGRRSDMMMKYLLQSGRVRRVLQFDAPKEIGEVHQLAYEANGPHSAAALVLRNIVDDQFGLRDRDNYRLRTFLWSRSGGGSQLLPRLALSLDDYPSFVADEMRSAGIEAGNAIAWVCPVVFDFPEIARAIPFRGVVGDLIDDQRTFEMSEVYRRKVARSYEKTLPLFDITLTNCRPVADAFAALARTVAIVPNGTEVHERNTGRGDGPLAHLRRPIAGYVGNLRDRIDWALLHDAAVRLADVTFVIVGGGERAEDVAQIRKLPNVVFTGVVPYDRVHDYIAGFDVALVPHVKSDLTSRMNPLKIYNYFAAGKPIVSTEVENIDESLMPYVRFAGDGLSFAAAIGGELAGGLRDIGDFDRILESISWPARVNSVMRLVDDWLAASASRATT